MKSGAGETIFRYSRLICRDDAAARRAALAATLASAAILLAPLWPLVLAAIGTLAAAWLTGQHPTRIFRAAAWSAPVAAAYLAAAGVAGLRHDGTAARRGGAARTTWNIVRVGARVGF